MNNVVDISSYRQHSSDQAIDDAVDISAKNDLIEKITEGINYLATKDGNGEDISSPSIETRKNIAMNLISIIKGI